MYQLVYYYRETTGSEVIEREYHRYEFRLRRNALHFLREIIKNEYREEGFGTEEIASGISCYNSEKTDNGDRKITEIIVKVEKA